MKNKKTINCSVCTNYYCKEIAKNGGFRFWGCLMKFIYQGYKPRCLLRELACEAKNFLPEYSFRWVGGLYICYAPYGEYIWHFAVRMKQQSLWNYKEFQEGYKFGLKPKKPYRDANPYKEPSRKDSWDCGYILGLSKREISS